MPFNFPFAPFSPGINPQPDPFFLPALGAGGAGPPNAFNSFVDPSIDPGRLLFDRQLLSNAGIGIDIDLLRRGQGPEFFLKPFERDTFQAQLRERNRQSTAQLLQSILSMNQFNGFR